MREHTVRKPNFESKVRRAGCLKKSGQRAHTTIKKALGTKHICRRELSRRQDIQTRRSRRLLAFVHCPPPSRVVVDKRNSFVWQKSSGRVWEGVSYLACYIFIRTVELSLRTDRNSRVRSRIFVTVGAYHARVIRRFDGGA